MQQIEDKQCPYCNRPDGSDACPVHRDKAAFDRRAYELSAVTGIPLAQTRERLKKFLYGHAT